MLDPATSLAMAMMSGEVEIASEAAASASAQASAVEGEEIDLSASSMAFEAEVTEGEPQAMSGGGSEPIPQIDEHRLEREYIWGPGDGFAGVDELFVMFDRERAPWLVLQDASGDVAALCGRIGNTNNGISYVAAQWTWDAYGNVFSADHIAPHPFMSVGHKGLFVERLDVGVADASVPGSQVGDTPRLVPFGHLIYHNRNRTYNPQQGRFLQLDMNASGVALMEAAAYNGRGMSALAAAFDMESRYGDGANLYQYLGSNPWDRNDPMGLFFGDAASYSMGDDGYGGPNDPFDMVDEYIAEDYGAKAAWLENLYGNAEAGLKVLWAVAQLHPAIGIPASVYKIMNGEGSFWDYLSLVPLAGNAAKMMSRFFTSRAKTSAAYNAAKRVGKGCGCFTADTKVWTAHGLVAISQVVPGDYVIAFDEATGETTLRVVTDVFVREIDAPLVLVHLTSGEVIETTEEHPFFVGCVWVRADQLQPGDVLNGAFGDIPVLAVEYTSRLATVHNLEVEGVHNYRVGEGGVVVHNTPCMLRVESPLPASQLKARPASRGEAPMGIDGKKIELHHPDPKDPMRVREMLRTDHRGSGNYGKNHPNWEGMSAADRAAYKAQRRVYWEEMWDAGRFNGLPSP